jgi:hypothetical protein
MPIGDLRSGAFYALPACMSIGKRPGKHYDKQSPGATYDRAIPISTPFMTRLSKPAATWKKQKTGSTTKPKCTPK